MTHYAMTLEEHTAARGSYVDPDRYREGHRDYQPEMFCRTGDGHAHKDCTRDKQLVTCSACLKALGVRYNVMEAIEFAQRIKALGFVVYLAAQRHYGFITDDTGARVLSFQFNGVEDSLGGNYAPSRENGTGWRMDVTPQSLRTTEDVRSALYAPVPHWITRNRPERFTTAEQHLATYGKSSGYRLV